jgi:hypothetical protein
MGINISGAGTACYLPGAKLAFMARMGSTLPAGTGDSARPVSACAGLLSTCSIEIVFRGANTVNKKAQEEPKSTQAVSP